MKKRTRSALKTRVEWRALVIWHTRWKADQFPSSGGPRWHKYGPSAFAYVTTKCTDYYREESEVPNYLGSSPRHFFFVGTVPSKWNLRRVLFDQSLATWFDQRLEGRGSFLKPLPLYQFILKSDRTDERASRSIHCKSLKNLFKMLLFRLLTRLPVYTDLLRENIQMLIHLRYMLINGIWRRFFYGVQNFLSWDRFINLLLKMMLIHISVSL